MRDFLVTYHGDHKQALFVDPAEGSGTSRDVARELGVRYEGRDLARGFNLLRDDLATSLGEQAQSIWFHPPYAGMIEYSGTVWGDQQHHDDLSACGDDIQLFIEMMQSALQNIYRAVRPGGHYGVLLGSWRKNGRYHHLPALILPIAPGSLQDEIVKVQHNCTSERTSYSGRFVPIAHETLLVFRRDGDGTTFALFADVFERLASYSRMTARNAVRSAFRAGEALTLAELYQRLEVHPRMRRFSTWKAKVRQIVQDQSSFDRIAKGTYRRVV